MRVGILAKNRPCLGCCADVILSVWVAETIIRDAVQRDDKSLTKKTIRDILGKVRRGSSVA